MRALYLGAFAILTLAGCSSSSEVVVAKPKKGPAYVRICNLSSTPLDGFVDDQQAVAALSPGESTGFRIAPPKDQSLKVAFGSEKPITDTIHCKDSGIYTVLGMGAKGSSVVSVLSGEPRSADAGHAKIVFAHGLQGHRISAEMESAKPSGELAAGEVSPVNDVTPGDFKVTFKEGGKVLATQSLTLSDSLGYTAFLWQNGTKYEVLLMGNSTKLNLGGAQGGSASG